MTHLTRVHFTFIAGHIKEYTDALLRTRVTRMRWGLWCEHVELFAHVLAQTNPRFDIVKFLMACGTHHQGGQRLQCRSKRPERKYKAQVNP